MKGFEQVWSSVARTRDGEAVSPDLKLLVLRVHNDVATSPLNLPALKNSLWNYFNTSAVKGGRTQTAGRLTCSSVLTTWNLIGQIKPYQTISMMCWRKWARLCTIRFPALTLPTTSAVFRSNCSNVLNVSKHKGSRSDGRLSVSHRKVTSRQDDRALGRGNGVPESGLRAGRRQSAPYLFTVK
jgi:hypothetical protein